MSRRASAMRLGARGCRVQIQRIQIRILSKGRPPTHTRTHTHTHTCARCHVCTYTRAPTRTTRNTYTTHTHTRTHTHSHTPTHTHTHALTHAHVHMHTDTHAHTQTHTHTDTHMHTHTHTLTHTCTHTHTHTHTHTQTDPGFHSAALQLIGALHQAPDVTFTAHASPLRAAAVTLCVLRGTRLCREGVSAQGCRTRLMGAVSYPARGRCVVPSSWAL